MPECKHHTICHLDADANTGDGFCILHSPREDKDDEAFRQMLEAHRLTNGDDFSLFVFPGYADFSGKTFKNVKSPPDELIQGANFSFARFKERAVFNHATFKGGASFGWATFEKSVSFVRATFTGTAFFHCSKFIEDADFIAATFTTKDANSGATTSAVAAQFGFARFEKVADFSEATFTKDVSASFERTAFSDRAYFINATFAEAGSFYLATFPKGAYFIGTTFAKKANFNYAEFRGRTLFSRGNEGGRSLRPFSNAEVDFREVVIEPLDALVLRDADLRKCRFLGTDLRKAEITGAEWPELTRHFWFIKWSGFGVYDEQVMDTQDDLPHIERLYRELKQNYEDRRDYGQASDFHYGEKEMRRIKPKTSRGWKFVLGLYLVISGYGERCLRPLVCAGVLWLVSTFLYLLWGLSPKCGGPALTLTSLSDLWDGRVWNYSLRVMTLLKPDDLVPQGNSLWVNTFESLLGPLLIGLFALALRQRLKR